MFDDLMLCDVAVAIVRRETGFWKRRSMHIAAGVWD